MKRMIFIALGVRASVRPVKQHVLRIITERRVYHLQQRNRNTLFSNPRSFKCILILIHFGDTSALLWKIKALWVLNISAKLILKKLCFSRYQFTKVIHRKGN